MHKLFKILNIIIAVSCVFFVLHHVIDQFIFPITVNMASVDFKKDTASGSWKLTMDLENLTDRLIAPTILFRLRTQKRRKFMPDPPPFYKEDITLNLFPNEKRLIEHRIDLIAGASGGHKISMDIRQKRWNDF